MSLRSSAAAVLLCALSVSVEAGENGPAWRIEVGKGESWIPSNREIIHGEGGIVGFDARRVFKVSMLGDFDVDLGRRPMLEIVTAPSRAHWRLTGKTADGPETVLADYQTEGICRRNVATRLKALGKQRVTLRFMMWGWGAPAIQKLMLKRVAFVPKRAECDADSLSGEVLAWHERNLARAKAIGPVKHEHPSLRFRNAQKAALLKKARTTHRKFTGNILELISRMPEEKGKPVVVFDPGKQPRSTYVWGNNLLQLRPAASAPARIPWRDLYWHDFSLWLLAAALTDDAAFADQGKRWALALARWKFWMRPSYIFFDFGTSYPLQCLATAYDIGHAHMREPERAEVRAAIIQLAHGLYLNTMAGQGSIYNDLRGNHTSVTFCGLGMAGLALLGEHEEAACWVALAEEFMLNSFKEHTSGAWTESPSYGNYGVNEWLRLAEMLRNVTGRDHLKHPFLKRYGDFQLMLADWEGRDLAYNQGGAGARWNHWVFFYIAGELKDPNIQWLANFCIEGGKGVTGYGDAFWWASPSQEAERPAARNVGRNYVDIGLNVWRSGWEDDATILLHHCGRKGQHKEMNMNHFTLYVKGKRLLPDGLGTRTEDHNVPRINGRKQNKWGPGKTIAFHSDEVGGYSLGDATRSYGNKSLRHVLYLRDGALAIVDDIVLSERRESLLEFFLHPNGDTEAVGNVLRVTSGDVTTLGCVVDETGKALSMKAALRPEKRRGRATHDAVASRRAKGPTRTITFLRFGKAAAIGGRTLRIEKAGHAIDFVCGTERWRVGPGIRLARIVDGKQMSAISSEKETSK